MKPSVNIISRSNGVGLDSDAQLIQQALEAAGMQVTLSHCRAISPFAKLFGHQKKKFSINIFLERCFPRWLHTAQTNLLIPNQERYPERHLKLLRHIDRVLCKSHHAFEIFEQHSAASYTGFSSLDRNIESIRPDYQRVLHLAGKSTLKGTEDLLELWCKHPEWPELTLIQHPANAPNNVPANVKLISRYLNEQELTELLNAHGVHLCLSRSEGWGHYIVEAMSCSSLVVTTDAPPMNELITEERGILVPYIKTEPRHLGTNFYVDKVKLAAQLTDLFQASDSIKSDLGKEARQWYEQNHRRFSQELPQVVSHSSSTA